MPSRTINWPVTVAAVQAVLDGSPPQTQATLDAGVILREAVKTAGAAYDVQSNDGILNTSPYALSIQAWAATTAPAWVELDRVCRAVYKVAAPPPPLAVAYFGQTGTPPWAKNTPYTAFARTGSVAVPTVPNGFTYACVVSGVSNAVIEPLAWPIILGNLESDGSVVWQCVSALSPGPGGQPLPLPWDVTLQTSTSLGGRLFAATTMAASNPGLASLVASTSAISTAAIAARPSSNPSADAVSLAAGNALNSAIANANGWIAVAQVA